MGRRGGPGDALFFGPVLCRGALVDQFEATRLGPRGDAMMVSPEAPFGRRWQAKVGAPFVVDVFPMILGKSIHIHVKLTPAIKVCVGDMVVLMSLHMVGLPGDGAVRDEEATGVHQVELGLRGCIVCMIKTFTRADQQSHASVIVPVVMLWSLAS